MEVVGCGYLGAVRAASMAELGHEVAGIDVEPKVATLQAARAPFYEPGFEQLLERTRATGRVRFSSDVTAATGAQVHSSASGPRRSTARTPPTCTTCRSRWSRCYRCSRPATSSSASRRCR